MPSSGQNAVFQLLTETQCQEIQSALLQMNGWMTLGFSSDLCLVNLD